MNGPGERQTERSTDDSPGRLLVDGEGLARGFGAPATALGVFCAAPLTNDIAMVTAVTSAVTSAVTTSVTTAVDVAIATVDLAAFGFLSQPVDEFFED